MPYGQSDGIPDIYSDLRPVLFSYIFAYDESDGGSNGHPTRRDRPNIRRGQ